MEFTVIIIGAGPAGCAAAIQLARAGLDVLLIEAELFPRHRPGESLHPGVEPIFERLGVAEAINTAGFIRYAGHHIRWGHCEPEQFEAFGRDQRGEWLGYQAWRPQLDQILLQQAIMQGVTVWHPCRALAPIEKEGRVIGLETDLGMVRARFLLDCSGPSHWLSRKLNITWRLHSCKLTARYGYVNFEDDGITAQFLNPGLRLDELGWTWIAIVRKDLCTWARMCFDGVDPGPQWCPPELFDNQPQQPNRGADVTWRIAERLAGPGWVLLGDAALVLDPTASHGVLRALMSGMQAANLIANFDRGRISQSDTVRHYSNWLQQWFDHDVYRLRQFYQNNLDRSAQV